MATVSAVISVLALFVALARSSPAEEQLSSQLSGGISHFSQNFYKATADLKPGANLVMSPLSAQVLLALLSLGAEGDTLAELNRGLYLASKNFTRAAFKPALEKLNATEYVTLNIANKVYVKKSDTFALSAQFQKNALDVFQSEAENVDFADSAQAARTINSWVEKKTNDKIKNLIDPGSLGPQTQLVLINTIYFKGAWDNAFPEEFTEKRDFFVTSTEKIQVDMMLNEGEYRCGELADWDAKVLELPYRGYEMSMVFVLPNKVDGLAALEEKLAAEDADIQGHLEKLTERWVNVHLPKFKIDTTIDLKEVLPKINITKIFDDGAQLGGLLDNNGNLVVSEAVQKAFIEVNERGTEAAAASYAAADKIGSPSIQMTFEANHPFYYLLLHKSDIIFAGRLVRG